MTAEPTVSNLTAPGQARMDLGCAGHARVDKLAVSAIVPGASRARNSDGGARAAGESEALAGALVVKRGKA
jgi:hypothetical protein